ncbi:NAD(P)-binding protein [Trichoderma longibrachiatum ATCC 18648]|uniref:NAD(P)-binding protein n=1 Tax=Trichoderma longibrachiatum ATCC 18648 TaxID=983965 RepID=A0A2T4BSR0_TRILO|nr:NAD(P)-binding protein [Trichoderma longibrachiatum ATCC 18648]
MSENLVFITGASGYIGSHLVGDVLKAGHRVRVAVRSEEKSLLIKELYPSASDRIEYVVVPDMSQPSAYQDALKGVKYVFHLAGAMVGRGTNLQRDFLDPVVKGTLAILESSAKEDGIRKVVIVSSFLSLMPMDGIRRNPFHIEANTGERYAGDIGMAFPEGLPGRLLKYQTGKVVAHQAYRDWVKETNPKFEVVSVHPSQVFGPSLVHRSADELRGVNYLMWTTLHSDEPLKTPFLMVDVRDVSRALARISDANVPSGTELPLTGPAYTWKQFADTVKSNNPSLDIAFEPEQEPTLTMDMDATDKYLKMEWTSMEDTIKAFVDQQIAFSKA